MIPLSLEATHLRVQDAERSSEAVPEAKRSGACPLGQIGEIALIKKIQKWCNSHSALKNNRDFKIEVPLGDDAFVVKMTSNVKLAVTTDTLIEGTHFNSKWLRRFLTEKELWNSLGYKAIAVNLSDFAAMGDIQPLFAFVTLGLNGDISVDSVDSLYTGMRILAEKYRFIFAGGDIIRSEKSIISITILGKLISGYSIQRSGAKIRDILMVSGPLGLASAGLKILKKQDKLRRNHIKTLISAQILPEPRLKEGGILAGDDILATSLIDTSDDLMSSLQILSEQSRVGFEIELSSVPVHPALAEFCRKSRLNPFQFILYGGEDYQLLFTVPENKVSQVRKKIPSAYVLGEVKEKSFGIQVKMHGRHFSVRDIRFKHF